MNVTEVRLKRELAVITPRIISNQCQGGAGNQSAARF